MGPSEISTRVVFIIQPKPVTRCDENSRSGNFRYPVLPRSPLRVAVSVASVLACSRLFSRRGCRSNGVPGETAVRHRRV